MSEYSERRIQAILMGWLLIDRRHEIAIPNSTMFFPWEADMASVTKSFYAHEIEIKISKGDFARDVKDKPWKHHHLADPGVYPEMVKPNYFWYCTPDGMEIEVPEYAGWLVVYKQRARYMVQEKKGAPLLHKKKIEAEKLVKAARILSFRMMSEMMKSI
jgi:hypothetical protein